MTSCVSGQNLYSYLKLLFTYKLKLGWRVVLEQLEQGQVKEYEQKLVDEKFTDSDDQGCAHSGRQWSGLATTQEK